MLHVFSSDPSHPQSKDSYGNTDGGKTGYDTGITIVDSPQHSTKQSMLHVFSSYHPQSKDSYENADRGKTCYDTGKQLQTHLNIPLSNPCCMSLPPE